MLHCQGLRGMAASFALWPLQTATPSVTTYWFSYRRVSSGNGLLPVFDSASIYFLLCGRLLARFIVTDRACLPPPRNVCVLMMLWRRLHDVTEQVEGLKIPMSVGPPAVDKDNAGEDCIAYDVIINPQVTLPCDYLGQPPACGCVAAASPTCVCGSPIYL